MFDYDGVIVDSLEPFTTGFINACRKNRFAGVGTQEEMLRAFDGNIYDSLTEMGLDKPSIDAILRTFVKEEMGPLYDAPFFESMPNTLKQISEKNIIFIITSNISSLPATVLERNAIDCCEDIIGADKEKSKVKKIISTMKRYPDLPAYYVGDTKGDMIEGREAGAATIAVTWGWHSVEELAQANPDHIIDRPQGLVELLCP